MANFFDQFDAKDAAKPSAQPGAKTAAPANPFDAYDAPKVSTSRDVARSFGTGLVEGVTGIMGMPRDISNALTGVAENYVLPLANKARGALGLEPVQAPSQQANPPKFEDYLPPMMSSGMATAGAAMPWLQGSAGMKRAVEENVTGPLAEPQTTAGKYARTVGQFIPGAAMTPGGGLIGNVLKFGVLPGLTSEAAGQATEGSPLEPYARVAGGVVGSMAPQLAKRVVTPNPISPERRAMVDTLRGEGIDLTAGQATGSRPLRYMESAAGQVPGGGGRAAAIQEAQGEQYTRSILKRMGVDAPRATPEVIDTALTRFGDTFDRLALNNTLKMDGKFASDFGKAVDDYKALVGPANQAPIIDKYSKDMLSIARTTKQLEGPAYQELRSTIGKQATAAYKSGNGALGDALFGMQGALDDAMARAAPQADREAWNQVRREYSVWKTILPAVTGAGESAAEGLLSPSMVRGAVKNKNATAYARGKGDLAELARAGEAVLKPLPDSGTAGRAQAMGTLGALGAAGGFLAGGPAGAGAGFAAGSLAAPVLNALGARALMSTPTQRYLGNQMMPSPVDRNRLLLQGVSGAARGGQPRE
jgi:hypothetical protein